MKKHLQQQPAHAVRPIVSSATRTWMAAVVAVLFPIAQRPVKAQVVPTSGGAGTTVFELDDQFDIEGGTQAGGNLFHEFEQFDLAESQTANFMSESGVFNIVGQISEAAPSYIDGTVQVSGGDANLYLVNPAGVLFGPDAQLSLSGSFTATTADRLDFEGEVLNVLAAESDYSALTGNLSALHFTESSASAVVNQGDLAVAPGESISLAGGNVVNAGTLSAPGGEIGLVAVGGESTVRYGIPGSLLSIEVVESAVPAGDGFSATDLPDLLTGSSTPLVNDLEVLSNGAVKLRSYRVEAEEVSTTGTLSTRSAVGDGGVIALLGNSIDVLDAVIDASGDNGGDIRIGGDLGGQGSLPSSEVVRLDKNSVIRADGLVGSGGDIVIWSDNRAYVRGDLSAQATTSGGLIETSAARLDLDDLTINASGQTESGQWLIDPVDIDIVSSAAGFNQIETGFIENTLDSGTDVTISTTTGSGGNGDISLLDSIDQIGGGTANLTLTGRRFSTNGSTIDLSSTGQLAFEVNRVNPESVTDSSSIENAIAAIGSVNGDRLVRLGAGNYGFTEAITLDTNVAIEGAGPGNTVLTTLLESTQIFQVDSGVEAAISGVTATTAGLSNGAAGGGIVNRGTLTIDNSHFVDNRSFQNGGAIDSFNGGSLTVSNSEFRGNRSAANGSGGAIHIGNASGVNRISNTLFENNSSPNSGGAINAGNTTIVVDSDSRFVGNSAETGGAVRIAGVSNAEFDSISFEQNSASELGGAVVIGSGGSAELKNNSFFDNEAVTGGAIALFTSNVTDTSSTFSGNRAIGGGSGGAIYVGLTGGLTSTGSAFSDNTALTGNGGAVAVFAQDISLTDATFTSNIAEKGGGLIAWGGASVDLDRTTFTTNQATDGSGGAIRGWGSTFNITNSLGAVNGSLFSGNMATTRGGGLYLGEDTLPGASSSTGSTANISGTAFLNNVSSDGGGIAADNGSQLNISDTLFNRNIAQDDGGGIYISDDSTATIDTVDISNNTAADGGGGLYASFRSDVTLRDVAVLNNEARVGGGLRASDSNVVIESRAVPVGQSVAGRIADNTAQENPGTPPIIGTTPSTVAYGGGISQQGGSLTLNNVTLTRNESAGDGGGLAIAGDATTIINNNTSVVRNSAAGRGGGIFTVSDGALTLTDSRVASNQSSRDGGGLFSDTAATIHLTNTSLLSNTTAANGGGISLGGGGTVSLDTFGMGLNTAEGNGGAIHLRDDVQLEIASANVSDNYAGGVGGGIANTSDTGRFSLLNTSLNDNGAGEEGGAIYTSANSVSNLTAVGVERNRSGVDVNGDAIALRDGGAIYLTGDSGLTLERVGLLNNAATAQGGAIYYDAAAPLNVDGVSFKGNTADSSGGAIAHNATNQSLMLQNATFSSNVSQGDGGAVFAAGGTTTIVEAGQFIDNSAGGAVSRGGAIAIVGGGDVRLTDTVVNNNQSSAKGGGLYVDNDGTAIVTGTLATDADGVATVATARFVGNQAGKDGGGIAVLDESSLAVSGVLFRGNFSGDDGGGVAVTEISQATIDNSNFENNRVTDDGGGLYGNNIRPVSSGATKIALTNSRFIQNEAAQSGGGFHQGVNGAATVQNSLFRGNEAIVDGGGVHVSAGTLTLENSQLLANQARLGAGLGVSASGTATVTNTSFTENIASIQGGGAQSDRSSQLQLSGSTFARNEAGGGGGGLFNLGTAEIVNSTFSGNLAQNEGGGIGSSGSDAVLTLRNTTLTANSAGVSGGGIADTASQRIRLQNTIVAGNNSPAAADVSGQFVDDGNNLIGQAEGSVGFTNSLLVGTAATPIDPKLSPLADNGGPTRTHFLQADSAAIDAGANENAAAVDQRGQQRLIGSAIDIGAVEFAVIEQPALGPENLGLPAIAAENPTPVTSSPVLDPTLSTASFASLDSPLAQRKEQTIGEAEASVRRLEQGFGQSFADYWDLSLGPALAFSDVQAILRRAQEEYRINSAVIYAAFASEEPTEEASDTILQVEPPSSGNDLLNLSVVLPEGELVSYELPVTRKEVTRQVRYFRAAASDPSDAYSYRPLAQQLYQWLLAPIEKDLAAQNVHNLMYALDDGLRTAPVAAMLDSEGFSLQRYGISVVPSVGLMQADFPPAVRRATVTMGVSEFESQSPLPAVPIELAVVDEFVPASQIALNEETTLAALKGVQALEQPGILHLATHASFDRRSPEDSSIHLWNESLSMREFSQLDWGSSDLEMLILSACSTALGSRNSELGFAGLAAASGVDATVGSLWEVSDVGTLALMSEFYAQLEKTDLRFEALRQAQLALLNGDTRIEGGNLMTGYGEVALPNEWDLPDAAILDHPFFWSAFTMVGNPW